MEVGLEGFWPVMLISSIWLWSAKAIGDIEVINSEANAVVRFKEAISSKILRERNSTVLGWL